MSLLQYHLKFSSSFIPCQHLSSSPSHSPSCIKKMRRNDNITSAQCFLRRHLVIPTFTNGMVKMLFISPCFIFLLFFLFTLGAANPSANVTLLTLADLWETRELPRTHLFPTKTSTVYPEFAAIPSNQGDGRMHLTRSALDKAMENVAEMNGVLIHSICSYR